MSKTFKEICADMVGLKGKKNYDYANGGDEFGNFKRVAHFFEAYPDLKLSDPAVVCCAYAMKQLDAVLWAKNIGYDAKVETSDNKYQDIAIYFILMRMIDTKAAVDLIVEEINRG